ncbi:hypothetical protein JTB14_002329 [Gonioctena quinquepunctata]|nr:hypothetical protein JTB14_002329 [Gonioctena quinquepunctata]
MQERPAINADQEEVTADEGEDQRELDDNLRPQMNIRLPTKFQDYDLNFVEIDVPKTYQEAMNSDDSEEWKIARLVNSKKGLIIWYVDDGLIMSPNLKAIDIVLSKLEENFKITISDSPNYHVGLEINRESDGSIFMNRSEHIEQIVQKFGQSDAKIVDIPADPHKILIIVENTSDKLTNISYREALCNGAETWSSERQHAVTLSTTEAEYVAACQATKEAIWIRRLMNDIGDSVSMATSPNIDNQSAIKLIHNPEFHNRTKHVDIQFHFVRDKFQEGEIGPVYVSTKLQEADPLTKALPRTSFPNLRNLIGMKKKNEINLK